jgi:hypothetical protein
MSRFLTKPWKGIKERELSFRENEWYESFLKKSTFFTKALAFKTIADITFYPKYMDSVIWFKSGENLTIKNHVCECHEFFSEPFKCFFCKLNDPNDLDIKNFEIFVKSLFIGLTVTEVRMIEPPCEIGFIGIMNNQREKRKKKYQQYFYEARGPFILRPMKKIRWLV